MWILFNEIIYPSGHDFENGKCIVCGEESTEEIIINNLKLRELVDGTYEVYGYIGTFDELYISSGNDEFIITKIADNTFEGLEYISALIILPSNIEIIGENAFDGCSKLSSITFNEGLTKIDSYAFYNCNSLTTIVIPSTVKSIYTKAFYNCRGLETVYIPKSVTYMETEVFYSPYVYFYCEALEKPSGWDFWWNYNYRTVYWGYSSFPTA